jgi:preprotein translocase subunit SecA
MIAKWFDTSERFKRKYLGFIPRINQFEESMQKLNDENLQAKTIHFRERIDRGESLDSLLPEAFAAVREASVRTLGMRHFDVQLLGGIALFTGKIAEMKTGEGKTLVSTLPAYLEALSGKGVHIVTVNEYLVQRDSDWMGSIYKFLQLEVGHIVNDMHPSERIKHYQKDIVYGTNSEFGFDYLRDNMVRSMKDRVQGCLHYAIVDEVDSILVDEARTPLIISGPAEKSTDLYARAAKKVRLLTKEEDFTIDEKTKSVTITEEGISKLQRLLKVDNLYGNEHIDLLRHLNQALRALYCFHNEVDYIVKEQEVIIVDEFTGRLLQGRRYSDGLHQAIEAKENIPVKDENQTLATITFQNYFRMYEKLSGMTGTAKTEENEFREIYGLDVVIVPTNVPVARKDEPDIIYKTETVKFKKIVEEITLAHKKGQPVLVGTRSIEKSEKLSKMLVKAGVTHEVLNAKYHEKEAEIIKKAGERRAVTIATNMAGRGVDIVLGSGIRDVGGLYVIGTERHESRRIDNQLRGRSGRQGDPGATKFFLSLDDELLRIFGGDRITKIFNTLKIEEDMPLESGLLTRAIENAQKKVESYNFDIRKTLLEYDNVLNKQREIIYEERKKVLECESVAEHIQDMLRDVAEGIAHRGKDPDNRFEIFVEPINRGIWEITGKNPGFKDLNDVKDLDQYVLEYLKELYLQKEQWVGSEQMRDIERQLMLYIVDNKWKDHLYSLDQLKEGIGLRGYAQTDPLLEYQREGFQMFDLMLASIKEEVITYLFKIQITPIISKSADEKKDLNSKDTEKALSGDRKSHKIGRNDLCPCGSGKKFKKCCGDKI